MSTPVEYPPGTHIRPGVKDAMPVDLVVFDMDGVLLDVFRSFREVVCLVVLAVQHLEGRTETWRPSQDDISAFKQAGGFNDDIVLSQLLSRLALAGEGGHVHRIAIQIEHAGGGMAGLERVVDGIPPVDHQLVQRLFDEYYWGFEGYRSHFGEPARYVIDTDKGFAHNEKPLATGDVLVRLRAAGVEQVGIITGRNAIELESGLEKLGWTPQDIAAIVTGDVIRKPDPACLDIVIDATGAKSVVFVGDNRDDWELVRRYRSERDTDVEVRAIMVASGGQVIQYRQLGLDACVRRTDDALLLIERWKENAIPKPGLLDRLMRRQPATG